MRTTSLLPLTVLLLAACQPAEKPNEQSTTTPANISTSAASDPSDWHHTDSLFTVMGGVEGKTVADLFAGDGYYTFALVKAGARVIAMDDNADNVAALQARKQELGLGDDKLVIRSTAAGALALAANEADLALCTRSFVSIPDRHAYFDRLRGGLKAPSTVYVVDFLPEQTPVGPPMDQRMGYEQVIDELEQCGFNDVGSYWKKLPYRYIVFATATDPSTVN